MRIRFGRRGKGSDNKELKQELGKLAKHEDITKLEEYIKKARLQTALALLSSRQRLKLLRIIAKERSKANEH